MDFSFAIAENKTWFCFVFSTMEVNGAKQLLGFNHLENILDALEVS